MREFTEISKDVDAKYACAHEKTLLCNKPDKNGRPRISHQCIFCGRRVGSYQPQKDFSQSQLESLPPWNIDLEKEHSERISSEKSKLWQAEQDKEKAQWQENYAVYLKSPKWKALRKKVIERAKGVCEGCRTNKATQAHHLTYERVGDEMLFDLVAICNVCHSKVHQKGNPYFEEIPDYDDDENFPSGDESLPF